MAVKKEYLDYVLGQLSEVENFTHKKMFGGIGFFRGEFMWGALMGETDVLRLKVDESNKADFEAVGSTPFSVMMKGKLRTMTYWSLPEYIIADKSRLADWVEKATLVAERTKKKKKKVTS
ncbi:MAG: TfoX/Sxy family protein [Saprospiraceae bacterium]|nr:TfoX/Sxy family protein [Saprospiraceae bacterium]MCF8249160.1 TfoX/Sxy family protein [Saprospiraceae bacterium]MCF8278898.1 TfoX/Sxy family protein [Bacteroidales bacterium]MCF8311289.1 TfoX/Sxy family protein [Saprospiraceae bacterium]MCF8440147.1 TfoX/Sxy family protein [Saprospiraceae bacterium]